MIDISVEHSAQIDRAGYLSLFISANKLAASFNGPIEGQLNVDLELKDQNTTVQFPMRLNLIPTPPKRLILYSKSYNLTRLASEFYGTNSEIFTTPPDLFLETICAPKRIHLIGMLIIRIPISTNYTASFVEMDSILKFLVFL
jgi:hypothetical protein